MKKVLKLDTFVKGKTTKPTPNVHSKESKHGALGWCLIFVCCFVIIISNQPVDNKMCINDRFKWHELVSHYYSVDKIWCNRYNLVHWRLHDSCKLKQQQLYAMYRCWRSH